MVLKKKYRCGCDRVITGGILFLVIFTPLAFGTVHPWAFITMEVVIFFLIVVWMLKLMIIRFQRSPAFSFPKEIRSFTIPLLLFIGFAIFQLIPVPFLWLRTLSPATYDLYVNSLPGWPEKQPYEDWLSYDATGIQKNQDKSQDPIRHTQPPTFNFQESEQGPWLPLSIAPELSKTDLLKILAYAGLFFLLLLYPFDDDQMSDKAEERFYRIVLRFTFYTGGFVAFLGVAQRFTWNGKILRFFIPYDWPGPMLMVTPRASGPFVNPDHFANYLAMLLPLALVGFVSRVTFNERSTHIALRLFFGLSVVLLLIGLLLSLSRGGWLSAAFGLVSLLFLLPAARRQQLLGIGTQMTARFFFSVLVACLVVALYLIGPTGRSQIDQRINESVMRTTDFWIRVSLWQDSLKIVQNFPLFGVGLGAWPEVFPQYQRPPWSPNVAREAHNDYVQGLAELGSIGFGLLLWFFSAVGLYLYRGLKNLSTKSALVYAALLASLNVMALHECVDFNLQISANAFLFTLFLALALRVALKNGEREPSDNTVVSSWKIVSLGLTGTAALLLGVVALRQELLPYPYNLQEPTSIVDATKALLLYPAHASTHISMFDLTEKRLPNEQRLVALERALWLSPLDPATRDFYARGLRQVGKEQEGLQEITHSMFLSPRLSTHENLTEERIAVLSEKEQQALESGLLKALAAGWEDAVPALGSFYQFLGRYAEAGKVYEDAALKEEEEVFAYQDFLNGGIAFTRAGEFTKAEGLFRQAIHIDPRNARSYRELMMQVCAAREELTCAKAIVTEGLQNGVAPIDLLLALANAAEKMGEREATKAALTEALQRRSSSFEALIALGKVYLQEKNFGRAASVLRKAAAIRPDDASIFYALAVAEEGRYQFAAAQKAYSQAVTLKPQDTDIRQRYEEFQRKVVESQ